MSFPKGPTPETQKLMKQVAAKAGKKGKSLEDLSVALNVMPNVVRRAVKHAVEAGLLVKQGQGRSTTYAKAE